MSVAIYLKPHKCLGIWTKKLNRLWSTALKSFVEYGAGSLVDDGARIVKWNTELEIVGAKIAYIT